VPESTNKSGITAPEPIRVSKQTNSKQAAYSSDASTCLRKNCSRTSQTGRLIMLPLMSEEDAMSRAEAITFCSITNTNTQTTI